MTSTQLTTTQVFRVFIKATPEAVWQSITDPAWNSRYGYHCVSEYDLRPGGPFRVVPNEEMTQFGAPTPIIDGEVLESDPPHRLVQTWRALWDEQTAAEPYSRVTFELVPQNDTGVCRLTVTHELQDAPLSAIQTAGDAENAGGGWPYILSDLKTFLETGTAL